MPRLVYSLLLETEREPGAEMVEFVVNLDRAGTCRGIQPIGKPRVVHLQNLTNLTGLYLGETQVTDAGLIHLKRMTKMDWLQLDTVAVTDAGLEHLKHMTALTHLDLHDTKVTKEGVARLQKALPNCRISGT